MGNIKQINLKNRTSYFFDDMINIEDFDLSLLKTDKKAYKNIGIYYIGYITIKNIDGYEKIHRVNSLYLTIGKVDRFIEEKNGSKYLVFDSAELHSVELHSTDKNKEVLKK